MSYILDALKKAAEQRNVPAPEVRRLLAPSPVATVWPPRHITLGAVALGAIAMAVVVWLWRATPEPSAPTIAAVNTAGPPPADSRAAAPAAIVPAPPTPASAPTPALAPAPVASATPSMTPPADKAPAVSRPASPPPRVSPPGSVTAPQAPIITARPATPAAPPPALARPTPPAAPPPAVARPTPPRVPETPVADVTPTPTLVAPGFPPPPVSRPTAPPGLAAVPPGSPSAAPSRLQRSSFRVEVIVYSDERAKRMAFINGRKYVEGDAVGTGMVLEEIQPNAVVINEDGRRVTLRP